MGPDVDGATQGACPALNAVVAANPIPDLDLPDRVESILSHDPKDSDAETYAIVGTEVPTVSRTLAKSYAVFLRDRSVVTKLNAHATAYLIALKKKVDALSATMDALNTTLDKEVPAFNSAVAALNRDIDSFNRRAETLGGFYSQQQFNVARAALINRQDSLKRRDKAINAQVDTYNADLTTLKGLSATAASLQPGLNVTLSPVPDLQTA